MFESVGPRLEQGQFQTNDLEEFWEDGGRKTNKSSSRRMCVCALSHHFSSGPDRFSLYYLFFWLVLPAEGRGLKDPSFFFVRVPKQNTVRVRVPACVGAPASECSSVCLCFLSTLA